jgi:hypothetical protein
MKKSTDERKLEAPREKVIGIRENHHEALSHNRPALLALAAFMSSNENRRLGLAGRTDELADPARKVDRVELRPGRPPTCQV